jgi:hypothetical protein
MTYRAKCAGRRIEMARKRARHLRRLGCATIAGPVHDRYENRTADATLLGLVVGRGDPGVAGIRYTVSLDSGRNFRGK